MLRLLGEHALNDRQVVRNIINPTSGFRNLSLNLTSTSIAQFPIPNYEGTMSKG